MSRKAMEPVVTVVLAAVVLLLLIGLTWLFTTFFTEQGKIGACQASIFKASILQEGTGGLVGAALEIFNQRISFLKCNDLPDTKITLKQTFRDNKINDNAVKRIIADSMLRCWNMIGKGQIDPYKYYEGNQVNCLICSDVVFEEDFVEKAGNKYNVSDIIYWLATNTIPDHKQTYFEALYGIKPDTRTVESFKNQEYPLDLTKEHAIVWRMDADKKDLLTTLTGVGAGTFGLPLAAAAVGIAGGPITALSLATAGMVGSYWLLDKADPKEILSTSMFLIPKQLLGEELTLRKDNKDYKKQFCTKLVNY